MTVTVLPTAELAGLPESGPASLAAVKSQLRIDVADTRDDELLGEHVAAVNAVVRRWPVAAYAVGAAEWPDDTVRGAVMLVTRLWRRKDSPAGIEAFSQLGPAYVMRSDPDIAMLLQLGSWAPPGMG